MGVKLVSSSGGSVELVAPTTASNFTHTVPAQTGTVLLKESTSGMSVPAFYVTKNATQSGISSSTWTKVTFQTKDFDTATAFDNTTNYRFQPAIAGYYQFNFGLDTGPTNTLALSVLQKNGVNKLWGSAVNVSNGETYTSGSGLLYLNGSTDYVEVYVYIAGTGAVVYSASSFSGFLARAA